MAGIVVNSNFRLRFEIPRLKEKQLRKPPQVICAKRWARAQNHAVVDRRTISLVILAWHHYWVSYSLN